MKKKIFKYNNIKGCTIKALEETEWWQVVSRISASTIFHTPVWFKLYQQYRGGHYQALAFNFSNNRHLFFFVAIDKQDSFSSSPFGNFGDFLTEDEFSEQERNELISYLQQYTITIRQNPYNPVQLLDTAVTKTDFTQNIYLPDIRDSILDNWSNFHKKSLKKGQKLGVTVRQSADLSDWKNYHQMYTRRYKDWGETAGKFYDFSLFEILQNISSSYIKLWLANYENKIIAGGIFFYYNKKVIYWHASGDKDYFYCKPYQVLHYEVIKDAIKNGYEWYDFNPSGGYAGVEKFKEEFGAIKQNANVIRMTTTKEKLKNKMYSIYSKIKTK